MVWCVIWEVPSWWCSQQPKEEQSHVDWNKPHAHSNFHKNWGGSLNECAHGLCKCAKYLHRFEYALQMFAYDQSQRIKYISDTVILRLPKHVIYSHVAFVHVFTVSCWNDASKWIVYPQFGSVSIEFCSLNCIILFGNISGTNGWVIAKKNTEYCTWHSFRRKCQDRSGPKV